jgi:hypothetical protein
MAYEENNATISIMYMTRHINAVKSGRNCLGVARGVMAQSWQ